MELENKMVPRFERFKIDFVEINNLIEKRREVGRQWKVRILSWSEKLASLFTQSVPR